jgi:hypothetical protein
MVTLFIRLFPTTLLACSVTLGLLLSVAHRTPLSDFGTGLARCAGPCWAGIVPGRTRFEDTADLMAAHFPAIDLRLIDNRIDFRVLSVGLAGRLYGRDGVVDRIQVNKSQPLWAALLTLGAPQCIQYIDLQLASGLVNIFWTIDDVHVMANVILADTGTAVITQGFQFWMPLPESPCITSDNTLPWPGFLALN